MEENRLAGYRIIEFALRSKEALVNIAERLLPHEQAILDAWVQQQCDAWQPPGLSRSELRSVFAEMLHNLLAGMQSKELEQCVNYMEEAGAKLAASHFPFEALVVSVHFLEESYLPFLLKPHSDKTQEWLLSMDEFLHAAIAAISTSYFEAYRRELLDRAEVGRIVQEGLLANIPRKTANLEIAHAYISARERAQLGGDFLDHFIAEGADTFLIGDLAGHGLEAAGDSVMLRSLFRAFMREKADLCEATSRLNRVLMSELKSGLFATALAIRFEPPGKISLVSAGHCCPILCNDQPRQLDIGGLALAVKEDSSYDLVEEVLLPGGVLVAFTDGLVESRNGVKELFGEERIITIVDEMKSVSARGILEHLIDESLRHGGGKFDDDVAVLVIKRRI